MRIRFNNVVKLSKDHNFEYSLIFCYFICIGFSSVTSPSVALTPRFCLRGSFMCILCVLIRNPCHVPWSRESAANSATEYKFLVRKSLGYSMSVSSIEWHFFRNRKACSLFFIQRVTIESAFSMVRHFEKSSSAATRGLVAQISARYWQISLSMSHSRGVSRLQAHTTWAFTLWLLRHSSG